VAFPIVPLAVVFDAEPFAFAPDEEPPAVAVDEEPLAVPVAVAPCPAETPVPVPVALGDVALPAAPPLGMAGTDVFGEPRYTAATSATTTSAATPVTIIHFFDMCLPFGGRSYRSATWLC
jgi:hypothetical protein